MSTVVFLIHQNCGFVWSELKFFECQSLPFTSMEWPSACCCSLKMLSSRSGKDRLWSLDSVWGFLAFTVAPCFTLWFLLSLVMLGDATGFSELGCLLQIPWAPCANLLLIKPGLCLCHGISKCPPSQSPNHHCLFCFHPTELTRPFLNMFSGGSNGSSNLCSLRETSPKPNSSCPL